MPLSNVSGRDARPRHDGGRAARLADRWASSMGRSRCSLPLRKETPAEARIKSRLCYDHVATRMEHIVMEWRERISIDPAVCHGQACIRGTRIPVAVVLDNLAAGLSADEIVASYPALRVDDVRAATAYAAELARERFVEIVDRGAA